MSKSTIALICYIVAVILAAIAGSVPAVHARLLAYAVGAASLGLAVQAS